MATTDVWQGTLALMALETLETLSLNDGTLYPALLRLEQEECIRSEWGLSDNHRKAKFYQLTRAGRKRVENAADEGRTTTAILERFLESKGGPA